jgi:hypothetical protein
MSRKIVRKVKSDEYQTDTFFFFRRFAIFYDPGGITPLGVLADPFSGRKMRVHLLMVPGVLVIWVHPS